MSATTFTVRPRSSARVGVASLTAAIALHVSLVVGALHLGASTSRPRAAMEIVALPPPAAPPALEQPPPPVEEPPARHPMRTPRAAAKAPSATRPPPAAAARPLTQVDDGQAPVDLTDSLVVGKAETYAGKTTAAKGTSIRPGGPGPIAASNPGDGEASAKRGELDLTRPPRLGEGTSWSCPFPPEADQRGIDEAVVRLALQVDDRGRVTEVMIEQDPGNGFGREAVACARSKTFSPGLDQRGKPVPGRTRVEVRFQR